MAPLDIRVWIQHKSPFSEQTPQGPGIRRPSARYRPSSLPYEGRPVFPRDTHLHCDNKESKSAKELDGVVVAAVLLLNLPGDVPMDVDERESLTRFS
jgi:hypothetical protein